MYQMCFTLGSVFASDTALAFVTFVAAVATGVKEPTAKIKDVASTVAFTTRAALPCAWEIEWMELMNFVMRQPNSWKVESKLPAGELEHNLL